MDIALRIGRSPGNISTWSSDPPGSQGKESHRLPKHALGEMEMHEHYRDEKIKELRDQLTRFALRKRRKSSKAAFAGKTCYGEIEVRSLRIRSITAASGLPIIGRRSPTVATALLQPISSMMYGC